MSEFPDPGEAYRRSIPQPEDGITHQKGIQKKKSGMRQVRSNDGGVLPERTSGDSTRGFRSKVIDRELLVDRDPVEYRETSNASGEWFCPAPG